MKFLSKLRYAAIFPFRNVVFGKSAVVEIAFLDQFVDEFGGNIAKPRQDFFAERRDRQIAAGQEFQRVGVYFVPQ